MFLGGINFKELLSEYQEVHALVIGFCEGICPWWTRHKISDDLKKQVESEFHYYVSGRIVGIIALIGIARMIKEIFF